jgi:hypothetical protein
VFLVVVKLRHVAGDAPNSDAPSRTPPLRLGIITEVFLILILIHLITAQPRNPLIGSPNRKTSEKQESKEQGSKGRGCKGKGRGNNKVLGGYKEQVSERSINGAKEE